MCRSSRSTSQPGHPGTCASSGPDSAACASASPSARIRATCSSMSTTRSLASSAQDSGAWLSPQVETPIVATQGVSRWILEIELAEVGESRPPAERVGRTIPNLGKGMQETTRVLEPDARNQCRKSLARQSFALVLGEDHPPGLIDELISPGLVPVADVADDLR